MTYDDIDPMPPTRPNVPAVVAGGGVTVTPLLDQIAAALAKAQGEFGPVPKARTVTVQTKTGGSYTFSYAPLDTILDAVRKPLAENGLAITQLLTGNEIVTMLLHASGQYLESRLAVARGSTPQEFGSAITYLRRYSIQAILGIAAEEDDDGNAASGNHSQPVQPPNQRLAARVRDTGRPSAAKTAPGAAPAAPVAGEAAPGAPGKPETGDKPTDAGQEGAEIDRDPAVIPSSDDGQDGLTFEEFKRMAREKGFLTGYVLSQARVMWPEGVFSTAKDIEDLSDADRFGLWQMCIANA